MIEEEVVQTERQGLAVVAAKIEVKEPGINWQVPAAVPTTGLEASMVTTKATTAIVTRFSQVS